MLKFIGVLFLILFGSFWLTIIVSMGVLSGLRAFMRETFEIIRKKDTEKDNG